MDHAAKLQTHELYRRKSTVDDDRKSNGIAQGSNESRSPKQKIPHPSFRRGKDSCSSKERSIESQKVGGANLLIRHLEGKINVNE